MEQVNNKEFLKKQDQIYNDLFGVNSFLGRCLAFKKRRGWWVDFKIKGKKIVIHDNGYSYYTFYYDFETGNLPKDIMEQWNTLKEVQNYVTKLYG